MKLLDRVAIITGGGRGIGKAIALAFAREGAKVVVASRTFDEVEQTSEEIVACEGSALPIRSDVSKQEDVDLLVRTTIEAFGTIDVLVNNAGIIGPIGSVIDNDVDLWVKTLMVNLVGTFLCTRAVLPIMMRKRRGKIINLSGGGGGAFPRFSAYSSSKLAVVRFTETVADEVKEYHIDVNSIAPGPVNTKILDDILAAGHAAGEKEFEKARLRKESGGTPAEIPAQLAVFLASDESNGLSGKLISAVHDDWHAMVADIPKIVSSHLYSVRRIDSYTLRQVKMLKGEVGMDIT